MSKSYTNEYKVNHTLMNIKRMSYTNEIKSYTNEYKAKVIH